MTMKKNNAFIRKASSMDHKSAKNFSSFLKKFSDSEDQEAVHEGVEVHKTDKSDEYEVRHPEDGSVTNLKHNPETDEMKLTPVEKSEEKADAEVEKPVVKQFAEFLVSRKIKQYTLNDVRHFAEVANLSYKQFSELMKIHDDEENPKESQAVVNKGEKVQKELTSEPVGYSATNDNSYVQGEDEIKSLVKQFADFLNNRKIKKYTMNDVKHFSFEKGLSFKQFSDLKDYHEGLEVGQVSKGSHEGSKVPEMEQVTFSDYKKKHGIDKDSQEAIDKYADEHDIKHKMYMKMCKSYAETGEAEPKEEVKEESNVAPGMISVPKEIPAPVEEEVSVEEPAPVEEEVVQEEELAPQEGEESSEGKKLFSAVSTGEVSYIDRLMNQMN